MKNFDHREKKAPAYRDYGKERTEDFFGHDLGVQRWIQ